MSDVCGKASSHPGCHSSGHFFSTLKLFAKHVSLREGTTIQMDDRPAGTRWATRGGGEGGGK